jgi:hypothetical protein
MQKVCRIRKSSASFFREVDKNSKYNSHMLQVLKVNHDHTWGVCRTNAEG